MMTSAAGFAELELENKDLYLYFVQIHLLDGPDVRPCRRLSIRRDQLEHQQFVLTFFVFFTLFSDRR